MRTHVALLRGVNVGGHNKLAMADLREAAASAGHTEVATYRQSGNVVLASTEADPDVVAAGLRDAVARRTGIDCGVVVLSSADWAGIIAANPYPAEHDHRHLHAVVRPTGLSATDRTALQDAEARARARGSADELTVVGRTVYLRTPNGMGRSELSAQLARLPGTATGTARNWATVTGIMALLGQ